jgi:hypothetical protein
MIQFIAYSVWGFFMAWLTLNAIVDRPGPVYELSHLMAVGSLLLLIVAAPLGLFLPRISAVTALVGIFSMALWPSVGFVVSGHWLKYLGEFLGGFVFYWWPGILAAFILWRTRNEKWLAVPPRPRLAIRVPLAFLPIVIFAVFFDIRLVVALLFGLAPPE